LIELSANDDGEAGMDEHDAALRGASNRNAGFKFLRWSRVPDLRSKISSRKEYRGRQKGDREG
jgi:hypothetical protein